MSTIAVSLLYLGPAIAFAIVGLSAEIRSETVSTTIRRNASTAYGHSGGAREIWN